MSVKDSAIHLVGGLDWSSVRTETYATDFCGLTTAEFVCFPVKSPGKYTPFHAAERLDGEFSELGQLRLEPGPVDGFDQVPFALAAKGRHDRVRRIEARRHQDLGAGATDQAESMFDRTDAAQAGLAIESGHHDIETDEIERLLLQQIGGDGADDRLAILHHHRRAIGFEHRLQDH